jgi:hypothetical protein
MRHLTDREANLVQAFFDKDRIECKSCRYTARINGIMKCGMLHFDCIVTVPVCLEVI